MPTSITAGDDFNRGPNLIQLGLLGHLYVMQLRPLVRQAHHGLTLGYSVKGRTFTFNHFNWTRNKAADALFKGHKDGFLRKENARIRPNKVTNFLAARNPFNEDRAGELQSRSAAVRTSLRLIFSESPSTPNARLGKV